MGWGEEIKKKKRNKKGGEEEEEAEEEEEEEEREAEGKKKGKRKISNCLTINAGKVMFFRRWTNRNIS